MPDASDLDKTAVSESFAQSAFDYRPGDTVGGDYRLVQILGRGGMGTVFTAEHRYIQGKQYALKLLSREQITYDNLQRFRREAAALARLSHPGIVQIYNFGIVRLAIDDERQKQKLTATDDIFGTPLCMSPEQTIGGPVTFASDVYSLGCTLYEVLTGRPPFKGANAFATLEQHQKNKPAALRDAFVGGRFSDAIESIVARMLAKRKEDRYQSMQQLSRDLFRAQEGKLVYAAGLTLEEIEQPLFEIDSKVASPLAQVSAVPKRWFLQVALGFCFVLCCLVFVFLSKPAAKSVQAPKTSHGDFKRVAFLGEDIILRGVADEGVTVTTFESPQQFRADFKRIRTHLITVSLNAGKPMPEFVDADHASQSDTGKLSKAIALLRDVKAIKTLKISSSSTGIGVTRLNEADVIAIEQAPPCKVLRLSDLSVPLESFMRLKYLQSVEKLKLANFSGLPPRNKAQSLSYVLNQLNSLPNLEHLVLCGYRLGDGDIDAICQARHLNVVEFFETQLSPNSVYKLSHSSSLKSLGLANQTFGPAEMRPILTGSELTDFVISHPSRDSELERVWTPAVEKSMKSLLPGFKFLSDTEGVPFNGKSGANDAQ